MEEHFSLMIAVKKVTIVDFPLVNRSVIYPSRQYSKFCRALIFPVLSCFRHFRFWFAGNFRRSDKLNDFYKQITFTFYSDCFAKVLSNYWTNWKFSVFTKVVSENE